tara:strand:+ start:50773 stop:53442 length:2670 start_codon:yes stop_codon:yes gene_type:complete
MQNWVYSFGGGSAEGNAELGELLGGKGANLAEMANLNLPVPPGFTITTEVCKEYYEKNRSFPDNLRDEVEGALAKVEILVGAKFGDPSNVLLVSVRSGARASMPGMMDTVLNLGLNDETVEGLASQTGDTRFARDSYRRFIQMYGDVVLGIEGQAFEDILERYKEGKGYLLDTEMNDDDLSALIDLYKKMINKSLGTPFPQEPEEQLWGAIKAVLDSWMNTRAITYRRLHDIPEKWGTAVNIQSMVFGNMGNDCATGVAFTRNPSTGERSVYGEFLINAQGEDVVAGIRTPQPIIKSNHSSINDDKFSMEDLFPDVYHQLTEVMTGLETHYRDMQDIEFTVQKGVLWILQTRSGKRTAKAALRIAVDLVEEGIIEKREAVSRIDPVALEQLMHPALDPEAERNILAKGLPASPGAASGSIVFSADRAEDLAAKGEEVILVRAETSPEDIHGMHAAKGIITSRGGMTSHAAVVARGMGRPCITGAAEIKINEEEKILLINGEKIPEGSILTVDGTEGEILKGKIPTIPPNLTGDFETLMLWADEFRSLKVRANAETPDDARVALSFGAEGIGLCRTEHMFFESDRIIAVREMILADDVSGRKSALEKLLPMQRADFLDLFRIMDGRPITIRLLDPPLHEFLPKSDAEIREVAEYAGATFENLRARAADLHEANPMLGHRGCRLGITYPEIYEMQANAIFLAASDAFDRNISVDPEIMIPLVGSGKELQILKLLVDDVAVIINRDREKKILYQVGTMIELPAAALRAKEIAETAAFFSFGTNDLTQTTLGLSRDDSSNFLDSYRQSEIFLNDPFASLEQKAVGELVSTAIERGISGRQDLKLGICGEHGGDPKSIKFFHDKGLDYISCSPYRVPIARLSAAQAALNKIPSD